MATSQPAVQLDEVRKEFGDTTAVDGIDIDLRRGEFFSLLGPSGCGKTTTLRMISGFETPTGGSIRIEGEDVVHRPPNKRNTNLVFQSLSLFPHMTVAENVGYGLAKEQVDPDEREETVETYLDIVGLSGYDDRKPQDLSGGQQQRVAIARALVNEPDILLLDEPLSSLDAPIRRRLRLELHDLFASLDIPVVYVTHDQRTASALGDRIAVLHDGRVEQVGRSADVLERPATPFVARFTGSENVLDARVVEVGADRLLLDVGDGQLSTTADGREAGIDLGETLTISVHPARFELGRRSKGTDCSRNRLHGTVRRLVNEGDQYRVVVTTSDGNPDSDAPLAGAADAVELTATVPPTTVDRLTLQVDDRVSLSVSADDVHLIG